MEYVKYYIHHNILHLHTLSFAYYYSPVVDAFLDMAPGCDPRDSATPWLSIRCVFNGAIRYQTSGGGKHLVEAGTYLIFNENHPFHLEPATPDRPSDHSAQSFSVSFPRGWTDEVYSTLTTSTDTLLSTDGHPPVSPIAFFEKRFPSDDLVYPKLMELYSACQGSSVNSHKLEAHLYDLLSRMLQAQYDIYREAEQLPSAKMATRVELYRRLHLARDFIHASLDQPLTLTDMARPAALSPYHFARCFKLTFQQTPHAYLTHLRLEKAKALLTQTKLSIVDICVTVGFQSVPSFTNLFRRQFGLSPGQYRKQL